MSADFWFGVCVGVTFLSLASLGIFALVMAVDLADTRLTARRERNAAIHDLLASIHSLHSVEDN